MLRESLTSGRKEPAEGSNLFVGRKIRVRLIETRILMRCVYTALCQIEALLYTNPVQQTRGFCPVGNIDSMRL